ncbi:MAG: hypothetical protein V4702_03815 [Patescibacteria group bacterium]
MKKFREWVVLMWKPILAFLVVAVIVCGILGFRLGSLTGGVSLSERDYIASVDSGRELLQNPTYALHKIPTYLLFKLDIQRIAFYRLVSVIFAALSVVSCFFILREWSTDRIAILGTWLFLTSAWLLHIGRLASPEASYLLILPLVWAAIWLYNTTLRKTALIVLSLLSGMAFYIPGFGVLLVGIAVWQYKKIWSELRQVPWWFRLLCGLIICILLLPLILASIDSTRELLRAVGLPTGMPKLKTIGNNLLNIPEYFLLRGPDDATKWLGRLPLFDAFSTVMMIVGFYSLRNYWRLIRSQMLIVGCIYFGILIGLGGPVAITVLVPIAYIFIALGLTFMLQQWYAVFPHNPIARAIATTLLSLSILLVSFYHLSHYFIAWPESPLTKQTFSHKLPAPR